MGMNIGTNFNRTVTSPQFRANENVTKTTELDEKKGLSKGAKWAIGAGLAILGTYGIYLATRGKIKPSTNSTKKEIIGILPEATGWSEEQWPKVSFVCTSIAQKYGLNAEKLRKYLDDVHDLICLSKNQDHHFRIDNIVDAELNYEFMKAIFKNNVDSAIWFLLSDLIPSIKGEWVKASNVSGSWLHEIIKAWADDKAHPYHHQARRLLFDMSMIYHV